MTTTQDYDWLSICDDIDDGGFDDGLDEIAKAIASRRDVVKRRDARRLIKELEVGDRVMLTNGITPRYYENMVGTVKQLRDGAAAVQLDELPRAGRGRPPAEGRKMKLLVPYINLIKLDPDDARAQPPAPAPDPAELGDDEEYEDDDDE